jgi:hypothetical protein
MIVWIRRIALSVIAVLTAIYLYRFSQEGGFDSLYLWHGRWNIIAACLLLNWTGIALEFVCWTWIYHRCGVKTRGFVGAAIYMSIFAAQLLPFQTGRLVRPDAAHRLGMGTLRNGIEAETSLIYMDVAAVGALVVLLAIWTISPLAAVPAACAAIACALGAATLASGWLGGYFTALRPKLFWSIPALCTVCVRMFDHALLGGVLFLLVRQDAPETGYINAALYVTIADSLGAASGMPGGMGVSEPVLMWLLDLARLPGAQVVIAVALYRILTYLGQLPIAWMALLYVEIIKRAPENAPAKETST